MSLLRRRHCLSLLGSAAAWPIPADAQSGQGMRRVGVLFGAYDQTDKAGQERLSVFLATLREIGWDEGRNLRFDFRWGAGNTEENRRLVADLVRSAPDAIVATSDPVLAELHRLTATIPVIFTQVSEPVDGGIVASLARPGGNKTGFQNFEPAIGGKWLEILKEVAPGIAEAGLLFSRDAMAHTAFRKSAQDAAPALGVTVSAIDIHAELEGRLAAYAQKPGRGLIVFPHPRTIATRQTIASLALRTGVPAIYPYRYFAADGGLIAYGPNQLDQWRGAALYLGRILNGENPGNLPVQTPTRYELSINLRTARAIALAIPPTLLARADEVVE